MRIPLSVHVKIPLEKQKREVCVGEGWARIIEWKSAKPVGLRIELLSSIFS